VEGIEHQAQSVAARVRAHQAAGAQGGQVLVEGAHPQAAQGGQLVAEHGWRALAAIGIGERQDQLIGAVQVVG
jgi:hypothetical protein